MRSKSWEISAWKPKVSALGADMTGVKNVERKRGKRGRLKEVGEIKGSAKSSAQSTHRASQFLLCPPGRPARGCAPQKTEEKRGRRLIELTTPLPPLHLHSPNTQLLQPRPCWRARTSLPPLLRVIIRREIRETGRRDSRRCLTRNLAVWWERDRLAPSERSYFCCCVRASSAERIVFHPRSITKRKHYRL
jgi:hypothetical protein